MTSRSSARMPLPSWGSAPPAVVSGPPPSLRPVPSRPLVRWGIRADPGADLAAGALLLAATAGLWVAFLVAAW